MLKTTLFTAGASALILAALPAAANSQQGDTAESAMSSISAGTYQIDKGHAYVTFSYSHLGYSRPILRFDDVDATVELNTDEPTSSTLNVMIDPASINSGVEKFDEHLVSDDMFDVANHDEITFTATEIDMETGMTGTLTGDLTIKGITKPVTLNVTLNQAAPHPMLGKDAFGISATTQLDRTEWDLGYAAPAVGTDVDLVIEAEFHKAD